MVNQGGVAPELEDHDVVLVGPYVGVVAEVHGEQGVPEALGKWRARPQNIEFLLEVGLCLEVEYMTEERSMGKRSMRRGA